MQSNPFKKQFTFLVSCSFFIVFTWSNNLAQSSQSPKNIDWILVIDTSASMVGKGGTSDIFSQVKDSAFEFIEQSQIGDSITIFTFDQETLLRGNLKLSSSFEKDSAKKIIQQLEAEGKKTHIGKALQDSLNYVKQLGNKPESQDRISSLIIFTDGIEDTGGISNPVSIPSNLSLINELPQKPFVFFVSLGSTEHESQLDQFANHSTLEGRAMVLRSPSASNLERNTQIILQTTQSEQEIDPIFTFKPQVKQNELEFNEIDSNSLIFQQVLNITSPISHQLSIQLESEESQGITLIEPNEPRSIIADANVDIPIRLQVDKKAIAGNRTLKLTLVPETTQPNTEAQITSIPANITIKPYLSINKNNLNLKGVVRGTSTKKELITIETNGQFNLQATLNPSESAGISLSTNLNSIQTSPNIPLEIPIQLNIDPSIQTSSKEITIDFIETQSRQSLGNLKLQIELVDPLWLRLLPIISPITLLLLLLAWLWKILNSPADLEGELELANHGNIDLARLKTKKINLSKELSLKIGDDLLLDNTQVELYTVKEDGKTKIVLHCFNGSFKINEFDQFGQEIIYDGDVIDIGQVQMIFRAIDHPRPNLSEDFL